jgi:hypothetical protein
MTQRATIVSGSDGCQERPPMGVDMPVSLPSASFHFTAREGRHHQEKISHRRATIGAKIGLNATGLVSYAHH